MQSVVVRCSAAQPRLRSVQQLPTLGSRVCEYPLLSFSLQLPPSFELSFFTLLRPVTRLRHPSLFHSRVPASRPRPNPCARVMIRDCVNEGGEGGQNLPSCVALSLSIFFDLSLILLSIILSFCRDSARVEWNGRVCYRSHSHRCRSSWPLMRTGSYPHLVRLRLTCTYKGGFIHEKDFTS